MSDSPSRRPRPGDPGTRAYTQKKLADKEFRTEFRLRAIETGSLSIPCHEFKLDRPWIYHLSVEDKELRDWFTITREAVHWARVDVVDEIVANPDLTPKEKHLRVWAAFMQADRLVPQLAKNLRGGPNQSVNIRAETLQIVTEEQREKLIKLLHAQQALEAPKNLPVIDLEPITENNTNGSHNESETIRSS